MQAQTWTDLDPQKFGLNRHTMPVNPFMSIDAGSTFNFGPAANFLQKSPATPESLVQRKSAVPHAKR